MSEDVDNLVNSDVRKQKHYASKGIQPIEVMCVNFSHDAFKGFLEGNILKYTMRNELKDGIRDLEKIRTYADWLAEYVRDGGITIQNSDGRPRKVYRTGIIPIGEA
jgi:hypothetical protein